MTNNATFDDGMRNLRIISLRSLPGAAGRMFANVLCADRGIDLQPIIRGEQIFVDEDLGYIIAHERWVREVAEKFGVSLEAFTRRNVYRNWRAELAPEKRLPPSLREAEHWYVERAEGWPSERGDNVRVAIIDDGLSAEFLKDGDADFGSCRGPKHVPWSIRDHGNNCARVLAMPDQNGRRVSPAPDSHLIAGQVIRGDGEGVWFVDLLLMLSWAVGCRKAQVVNLSFSLNPKEVEENRSSELLSDIALTLRAQNRALILAATDARTRTVGFPAKIDGFIAVGCCNKDGNDVEVVTGIDRSWVEKQELLFAPQDTTLPTNPAFSGSSASCAFASGVAALYVQRYLGKPNGPSGVYQMEDIVTMLSERLNKPTAKKAGPVWKGIKLKL